MKDLSIHALKRLGSLAILGAALIWGTSFVLMKNTLDFMPTMYLLAIRFSAGALILFFPCMKHLKRIDRNDLFSGLAAGAFLFAAYVAQTFGLIRTTPGKKRVSYFRLLHYRSFFILDHKKTAAEPL